MSMKSSTEKGISTFSRAAVSGSMTWRTSCTSWLTAPPTSWAPMRMTMLLGAPSFFLASCLSAADCFLRWLLRPDRAML